MLRLIRQLRRAVLMMLARGVIRAVDDARKVQELQADFLAGETKTGMERFQEYGFTSVPLPGMEVLAGFVAGNRDHGVVLAVGDRLYRLRNLAGGEVALYSASGNSVVLRANGDIEVLSPRNVTVTAAEILRLEAKHIELYATESLKADVLGYGWKMRQDDGAYRTDTWQKPSPPVEPGVSNDVAAPEFEREGA